MMIRCAICPRGGYGDGVCGYGVGGVDGDDSVGVVIIAIDIAGAVAVVQCFDLHGSSIRIVQNDSDDDNDGYARC